MSGEQLFLRFYSFDDRRMEQVRAYLAAGELVHASITAGFIGDDALRAEVYAAIRAAGGAA